MQKLVSHPFSKREIEFVDKFRVPFKPPFELSEIGELKVDELGRKYQEVRTSQKTSHVHLKLCEGTGKIVIKSPEGIFDIGFFDSITHREQLLFPFKVIGRINKFDMSIGVNTAGMSCFAKTIRYAISKALCSFVSAENIEKLRLCNLLFTRLYY